MGIFGDHNEAKRATTTAAMTRFRLHPLSCGPSGRVLHPVGDFLPYLISQEAGNPQLSGNAATSFVSFKPLRCQRGRRGKNGPFTRLDQRRSFSRSAEKHAADEPGGQKRSQTCGSDQQEHVPQPGSVAVRGPGPVVQLGLVVYICKHTRHTHARTLPASVSGWDF